MGPSFVDLRQRGQLSPAEIATKGVQLIDLLEKIHEKGYIHTDIRPEHILLAESEKSIHLIDFSKSQTFGKQLSDKKTLTRYSTPFVVSGRAPDKRDDLIQAIYSLQYLLDGLQSFRTENLELLKKTYEASEICNNSFLTPVLSEAYCCNFGVRPNYERMREILKENSCLE